MQVVEASKGVVNDGERPFGVRQRRGSGARKVEVLGGRQVVCELPGHEHVASWAGCVYLDKGWGKEKGGVDRPGGDLRGMKD